MNFYVTQTNVVIRCSGIREWDKYFRSNTEIIEPGGRQLQRTGEGGHLLFLRAKIFQPDKVNSLLIFNVRMMKDDRLSLLAMNKSLTSQMKEMQAELQNTDDIH